MRPLEDLARLYGVQTSYRDGTGRRRRPRRDAIMGVLRALGAPVDEGLEEAARHRRNELRSRSVAPVALAWGGGAVAVPIRPPADEDRLSGTLRLESGDEQGFSVATSELAGSGASRTLELAGPIPLGYHELHIEELGTTIMVISAPERAPGWGEAWGVFLPLYALWSHRSWGIGDLTDLEELMAWVASLGGRLTATLPLLATFNDELFEPSPYSPVSRMFWNEIYLDVTRVPELETCQEARAAISARSAEIAALQELDLVDHRRASALKRSVLELLSRWFWTDGSPSRREAFDRFAAARPDLPTYARFRAACERRLVPWMDWEDGTIADDVVDADVVRYHRYVQWIAQEQLDRLRSSARGRDMGLYLDLPVGVNRAGFDVWREPTAFALGANAGAPIDAFAADGQDWGFPPPHPERMREYLIASTRHLFRQADAVRIDHVLGLRRLFWIPEGFSAVDGTYVRYPVDELFAILTLEAHRERTVIVGEDLGTDPRPVRAAMARRGWNRTFVLQERFVADPSTALGHVPHAAVVSVNTHDTVPFAAFWQRLSDAERATLAARAGAAAPDARAALDGCLEALARSDAIALVVNLEDLWGETRPQNVPGTADGNWQRRARYPLERLRAMPEVRGTLSAVNGARAR